VPSPREPGPGAAQPTESAKDSGHYQPGASATIDHCTLDGSNATHAGIWHSGHSLVATDNNI